MSRGASPQPPPGSASEAEEREGLATEERYDPLEVARSPSFRVLVTGASGFIGSHLVPRLVSRGHRVRATWRTGRGPGRRASPGVEWRRADVTDPDSLESLAFECDRVVHLAGLHGEHGGRSVSAVHTAGTRNVLRVAREAGVERVVYMSALGANPTGRPYFRSKFLAEGAVMSGGIPWVVLRPSVVYGPGDHFTTSILALLRRLPAFPLLGDGTFRLQPVAVEDLIDAVMQSLERDDVLGEAWELAGPERLTFLKTVRTVARAAGLRRRAVIPLPERLAPPAVWLMDRLGLPTPFRPEQLDVLRWGSVLSGEENPLRTVFRVKPLPFRDALRDYLSSGSEDT